VPVGDGIAALLTFIGKLFERARFIDRVVRDWQVSDQAYRLSIYSRA